jgi:hypothetical protein
LNYCVRPSTADFRVNNTGNRLYYYFDFFLNSNSRISILFFVSGSQQSALLFEKLELIASGHRLFLSSTCQNYMLRINREFQNHCHILYIPSSPSYNISDQIPAYTNVSTTVSCACINNHGSLRIRQNKKRTPYVVSGLSETYNIYYIHNILYVYFMIFITIILLRFPSKYDRIQLLQHSTSNGRTFKSREKSIYHQLCAVSHG